MRNHVVMVTQRFKLLLHTLGAEEAVTPIRAKFPEKWVSEAYQDAMSAFESTLAEKLETMASKYTEPALRTSRLICLAPQHE